MVAPINAGTKKKRLLAPEAEAKGAEGKTKAFAHSLRQMNLSVNGMDASSPRARLIKRKSEITMTLRHVEFEQQNLAARAMSMDRDSHASRLDLLRYLSDWYSREIILVMQALKRIERNSYGTCVGCDSAIASQRLAIFPEAEFCADCEEFQQRIRAG